MRAHARYVISDYKNIFNAILLLKWLFSCIFQSIAFYICYKMGRFRFGGRLRGLESKLLINKIIKNAFAVKWVGLGLGVD